MSGPEEMYADLTSGDVGAVRAVEHGIHDAMDDLHHQIELIRYAADKPDWESPSARTSFNMRAWTTRAAAEVSFIRLNRAELAVRSAASSYQQMTHSADAIIHHWRRQMDTLKSPVLVLLQRIITMGELSRLTTQYSHALDAARDFVETDPLSDDQEDLIENGLARSMRRDIENGTTSGPAIPGTLTTGDDDSGGVPQGLGYDPDSKMLLQTSYNPDGGAMLNVIDPQTGELVRSVDLGAYAGAGVDHGGGVTVHDGQVQVMSSSHPPTVYSYSMRDVMGSQVGEEVAVDGRPQEMAAGAYSTIDGNTMYVGTFEENGPGELYSYSYDPASGQWVDPQGPFATPPQTQGVAIHGHEAVFSTSFGRDHGGGLQSYNLDDVTSGGDLPDPLQTVDLPNMSEGTTFTPEGVLTTFESGGAEYVDTDGHDLKDLWTSLDMTVTPYSELGLAGGIDVEPVTLQQAASDFEQAATGLRGVQGEIVGQQLPGSSLGQVPAAATFAHAITEHLDQTADWLGRSRISAGISASGLISTAQHYDDADSVAGKLLHSLGLG